MKKEKLFLLTLACIQFTHILDFMIMMPLGPQLMRLFQISPQQFGFIVASYTFSAGISGFAGAFFIDRFDRKTALMLSYTGFIIGTVACGFAPGYHFLIAARILTGAFGGLLGSLILSSIGDAIPDERRGRAMGTVMASFSAASVLGVPFGLFIATQYSWHMPFLFLGAVGVLVFILITRFVPSMRGHITAERDKPFAVLTHIGKDKNQLRALFLMILLMLGQFSVVPFISPYMVSNVGFLESQLPYLYLFGGLFSIFTLPLIGRWADKYGKAVIFTIFVLLSLIPLFLITNIGQMAVPLVLVITTFFFITTGGRIIPANAMVTGTVSPRRRGGFMSISSSMQQLAAGCASYLSGSIVTKGAGGQLFHYNYVGYIAMACSVICIFIARGIRVNEN